MPKLIDQEQRRVAIADALFGVIREGGFEKATLANVAARAGLAVGSVRHFLGTREELIAFAFATMADRIHRRVLARVESLSQVLDRSEPGTEERLAAVAEILCELLPLDKVRRDEAVVWVEFEAAARTDPNLKDGSARAAAATSTLVEQILSRAVRSGTLAPDVDLATETARLTALVDGLTLRGALHPELLSPDLARSALTAHLEGLRRPEGAPDAL